ncbi:MAG: hypothetical protein RLZZ435_414, partial [Cyanobacteriota bacterium]
DFLIDNKILSNRLKEDILEKFKTMNQKIAEEFLSLTDQNLFH